jgi:allantoinase
MSTAPAAVAGVGDRKGRIVAGLDADLVVFDPEGELTVEASRLFFRHRLSPYLGRRLVGRVERTVLRGDTVYDGVAPLTPSRGRPLLHRGMP